MTHRIKRHDIEQKAAADKMNTPPPRTTDLDPFDGTSGGSIRPARLPRYSSASFIESPLFQPHELIATLTAGRYEAMEAEADASTHLAGAMDHGARMSIGTYNNDPVSERRRNHVILLSMATRQANAGISSAAPQLIGPPLNSDGGTAYQDGGEMSIAVGLRSLKRPRDSTSSRGSFGQTPGSVSFGNTPGSISSFPNLGAGRARESLPGNARSRAPANLRQADLLRRAASTRNLPRSSLGATSYTGSPAPGPGSLPDDFAAAEMDVGIEDAGEQEDVEESNPSWEMIGRMRTWRNDAIMQHLYETAAFWGDKILSWTAEPNDAFWLAQAHFLTQNYVKAERILKSTLPQPRMPFQPETNPPHNDEAGPSTYATMRVNGGGNSKGPTDGAELGFGGAGADMDDEQWLQDLLRNNQGGLWGALQDLDDEDRSFSAWQTEKGRLCDWSMNCRYLLSLCLLHQEKFMEALQLVGEEDPFARTSDEDGAKVPSKAGDLKLRSSLCRVRGALHYRLNSLERAKECYMEALALDVRNYDVFLELVNEMMTPDEEWDFIQSLSYRDQLAEDDADFVRTVYTSRLNKYHAHAPEIRAARLRLEKDYNLGGNCDTMAAAAEDLYLKNRLEDCYLVTKKILAIIPNHPTGLRLHLACQAQLPRLASSLFMLAHKLVEQEPMTPTTWYAVGLWYFAGRRWSEARRYFAATHDEDSRFGPAWIAFAHTLAYEGEHEQAITAYSTTARMFPGNYYPQICIGMEYLQLGNLDMAEDHFLNAYSKCKTDPLLLNELGVIYYNKEQYEAAIQYFEAAVFAVKRTQGVLSQWSGTFSNLGHALRRSGNLNAAAAAYDQALRLDVLDVHVYTSLGMMAQELGNIRKAIDWYHKALSVSPQDAIATVLLESALPDMIALGPASFPGLPSNLARRDYTPWPVVESKAWEEQRLELPPLDPLRPQPRIDAAPDGTLEEDMSLEGSTMDIE